MADLVAHLSHSQGRLAFLTWVKLLGQFKVSSEKEGVFGKSVNTSTFFPEVKLSDASKNSPAMIMVPRMARMSVVTTCVEC